MTKQFLILAYILIVLVISSLVRAESVFPSNRQQGFVRNVNINDMVGILNVRGVFSSSCQMNPTIAIHQIDRSSNVVRFDVMTETHGDLCVDAVSGAFDLSFDLKELPLEVGKTYLLAFDNFENKGTPLKYTAKEISQSFEPYRVNKESLKGTLIYFSDQASPLAGFAVKVGDKTTQVVSPDMDLNRFQNRQVLIYGYAVDAVSLLGASDGFPAPSSRAETVVVPVSISASEPGLPQ